MRHIFIIYGEPKVGKTSLINSFKCKEDTLVLEDKIITKNTILDFITEITNSFGLRQTKFSMEIKRVDQIVVVTNSKLEDDFIKMIRDEVEKEIKEKILISQCEMKKY